MSSAQDKVDKAKKFIMENKIAEAEAQLRQAIALDRQHVPAKVELSRVMGATNRMDECEKLLAEALSIDANNADALALKGLTLAQKENYSEATDYYRRAIVQNPNLVMAYFNLGGSLRELDQLVESEELIRKGLELEPKSHYGHYELAQTLAYQLKIEESIHQVYETLKLNPFFIRGYLALAKLYHEGKETEEAIKVLKQCLQTNPEAYEAAELLKDFYLLKGDFDDAQSVWTDFVTKLDNADAHLQLGNICLASGDFEKAEESFKRAADLNREDWQPHYALAEIYDVAKLEDLAGQEYQLAVQLNRDAYQPHNGYGLWLLKKGELAESVKQLSLACKLAPAEDPLPVYNLALALVEGGQLEDAHELLTTALTDAGEGDFFDEMRRLKSAIEREINN